MNTLIKLKRTFRACPKSLIVLLVTEIPELFGRFGIMTTIALYLTKNLHQTDATAVMLFSTYLMLAAMSPMIGGYIADRLLGYKPAIVIGACIMIIGDILMVIPSMHMLYLGLAILVSGVGLFSPSLAALVSHLYKDKDQQRDNAFVAYYVSKNIGALLAPPICGVIGVLYGYHYCFLLTSMGMCLGLLVFLLNYHHVPDIRPKKNSTHHPAANNTVQQYIQKNKISSVLLIAASIACFASMVLIYNLRLELLGLSVIVMMVVLTRLFKQSTLQQRRNLGYILITLMASIAFLAMNQLCGASFNLFVERIIDRHYLGFNIPTSVFYSIDPLFMIIFGAGIAKLLSQCTKPNYIIASFSKFSMAMFIFSMAMLTFVMAAYQGTKTGSASGLYVVICYSLCATSELCIAPIALSLVTKLAPNGQTGLIVGLYTFGEAVASFITGAIAKSGDINFSIHSLHSKKMAAGIYQNLFSHLSIALLLAGILMVSVRGLLISYQKKTSFTTLSRGTL